MKEKITILRKLFVAVFLLIEAAMQVSGQTTIPVGATSTYTTIQAAYNTGIPADITSSGAYVIELQSNYDPAGETYPITLGAKTGASVTNSVTVRPATGVTKTLTAPAAITTSLTTSSVPNQFSGSLSTLASGYAIWGYGITALTTVSSISSGGVVTLAGSLASTAVQSSSWIADPTTVIKITSTGYDGTKKIYTVPNSTGVSIGMKVGGNGIPAGATVSATTATTITISVAGSVGATDMYFGTVAVTPYAFQMNVTDASGVKVGDMITGTGVVLPSVVTAIEGNILTLDNKGYTFAASATVSATSCGTIVINGAKYLTIDGQSGGTGGTKNLTITNTSTVPNAYTIKFINDCYKNNIKYCNVLGSATSTASAPTSGTIYIGGSSGITVRSGSSGSYLGSGNLYNTIDNCDISNADATATNLPTVGVFMKGSTPSTNEGNAITNCNINNFFNPGAFISSGIYNDANSNTTTITGNKFYQTATRTYTGNGFLYPIYINTSGAITAITDNVIGYSSSTATGRMTIDNGVSPSTTIAPRFAGVYVNNITNGTHPNIMGNTITAIDFTSASIGNGAEGVLVGIYQKAGNLTTATAAKPNVISNINLNYTVTHTATFGLGGYSYNFTSGGASYSYTYVSGLAAIPVGTNATSIVGKVVGIYSTGAFGGSGKLNKVYNLSCGASGSTVQHSVQGISLNNGGNQALTIERNLVYNLNAISSGASFISGLFCSAGTSPVTFKNNIVVLGNDVTSGATIRGILKNTTTKDLIYHNSIYIGGSTSGTTADTYAFSRTSAKPTASGEIYKNNIFVNQRSGGTTGKHYAFRLQNTADYSDGFIVSTNNLLKVGSDSRNVLAYIGADVADYSSFTTNYPNFATGCVNSDPTAGFISTSTPDLHITTSSPAYDAGVDLSATVGDDFDGDKRLANKKDIGADDISSLNTWTGNTSSDWDVTTNWSNAAKPIATNGSVIIPAGVTNIPVISATNAACNNLTLQPGAQLTLNNTKSLAVSGNLTINSDVTNGTATIKDLNANGNITVTGSTTVNQYLTSGRNWYISSPLTAAKSTVFSATVTNPLYNYVEPNGSNASTRWAQITANAIDLVPTRGYIAKMDATVLSNQSNLVTFTGGSLNTGNITTGLNDVPALTRTPTVTAEGFNLVGNPYPSYLDWENLSKTNLSSTVWYRTQNPGTVEPFVAPYYVFDTYGATANEGTNLNGSGNVTALIPPMQAFWVRVAQNQTSGQIAFTNAVRSHREADKPSNKFRVPKASTNKVVRLQVSNAKMYDETLVVFNSAAMNGFDDYDSQKKFNNVATMPEIYTKVGSEQLVINGLTEITEGLELPIGFTTGTAGDFSLKATELRNIDNNTKVYLRDIANNSETELTTESVYTFNSSVSTNNESRFSLIFRTAGVSTDLESAKAQFNVYVNGNNRIVIAAPEKSVYSIYNAMGQIIENGKIISNSQTSNFKLATGVYVVKVGNETSKVIVK